MNRWIFQIISFGAFVFSALAMAQEKVSLRVKQDSSLYVYSTKTTSELKAGVTNPVELSSPAVLTSPDSIPVILVPVFAANSEIEVQAPLKADVFNSLQQEKVSALLGKVLSEIMTIQALLRQHQNAQALQQLDSLQSRYPDVKFLNFIRASIYMLAGRRQDAAKLTEETMKLYPDYREGQEFLKNIKGGE